MRSLNSAPALNVVAEVPELNDAFVFGTQQSGAGGGVFAWQTDALIASNQSATITAFYNASMSTAGMSAYRDIESTAAFAK